MRVRWMVWGALGLVLGGCHTDMWVQPRVEAYEETDFFADKMAARRPVPGTVAQGNARLDDVFYTGRNTDKKLVDALPPKLTLHGKAFDTSRQLEAVLRVGQERFMAQCSPCHGAKGDGQGMITQRGLVLRRSPANYHTDRLRQIPLGHFYDVQTHGFGIMYSAASRVTPDERWAISAYIRALQLSQDAGNNPASAPQTEAAR